VDVNNIPQATQGKIAVKSGSPTTTMDRPGERDDDGAGPVELRRGQPCIVTATSSGSRGVYGAIATAANGPQARCAVAYTDKGSGMGVHDLQNNTVNRIDGKRQDATDAGTSRTSPPT